MSRPVAVLALLVLLAAGGVAWLRWHREASVVTRRLEALADEINASTTDGAGLAARATELSHYFTDDVVIELGRGTAEVQGRATVLDMMSRLQPRTSAFQLRLTDVGVTLAPDDRSANAVLTAEFIRRGGGEDSIDARELAIQLTKGDGTWRLQHVTIVEAFR